MNLFRSEEHARAWSEFDADMAWTLQPIPWWADTFSNPIFVERSRPDYISWLQGEGQAAFAELRSRLSP